LSGLSQTKLAVRPEAHQIKMLNVGLAVNQDEIRLDMAVAMIGPFTKKRMINVGAGQGHISGEQIHDFHQDGINYFAVPP
jgi:hypothetical protein